MSQPPSSPPPAVAGTRWVTLDVVEDLPGEFAERVVEAFHYRRDERFSIALTGGSTAAWCYERLAVHGETQIDWWTVDVFWVDESAQPNGHPSSHERLVREVLLDRVGAANALYPLRGLPQVEAATEALAQRRLDVVHLDLRADGSLSSVPFGPWPAAAGAAGVAGAAGGPEQPWIAHLADDGAAGRYAFTPRTLGAADLVVVTAAGASVRDALAAVRSGADVPGNAIGATRVAWLADHHAGG